MRARTWTWTWIVVGLALGLSLCTYGTLRLALGDRWDLSLDRGRFSYHSLAFERDSWWQRTAYHLFLPVGCVDAAIPRSDGAMAYTLHPNPSRVGPTVHPETFP